MTRTATCQCGQLSAVCSGEPVRISVCHCLECQRHSGSSLDAQLELIAIPIGTFADPAFLQPDYSVYEARKYSWVAIVGDDIERHD